MGMPIRISLFLALALWTVASAAHPCFERNFPHLYQAMQKRLTNDQLHAYLNFLTEDECFLLYAKIENLVQKASGKTKPTEDFLYAHYGDHLFGVLGEVYASAYARANLEPGEGLLDEFHYDVLNPDGNKPDGLVYRTAGEKLILKRVLESKMGRATYSPAQAEGYLKTWQQRGIVVAQSGKSQHFPPELVFVTIGLKTFRLQHIEEQQLRTITTLIGTSDSRTFAGEYVRLPFRATTARSMVYDFMGLFLNSLPHRPKEPTLLPSLRPEEIPDFAVAIVDFVIENGRWPKTSSPDGLERFLAKEISARGGQATVFQNDLSAGLRHYLTLYGVIPAIGPMRRRLLESSPSAPGALSTLRAYVRSYERRLTPIPIVGELRRRSPEWATHFEEHSAEDLRSADLNEAEACWELLATYSDPT